MTLLCRLNLFTVSQQIYVLDDNGGFNVIDTTNLLDVAKRMADLANSEQYKTTKCHLYGSELYINNIAKQIKKIAASKYANNNIEVEIN